MNPLDRILPLVTRQRRAEPPPPAAAAPRYSYCEGSWATPLSPWHIRVVGAEGYLTGGGISTLALCGMDLHHGWDISAKMTVQIAIAPSPDNRICKACYEKMRNQVEGVQP